jgi:tryptophan synthase alpha chain
MKNKLDLVLNKSGNHHLMNHIVAGYPDLETNMKLVKLMKEKGSSIIEIQIPFSDPIADGRTILKANHCSLESGTTVPDSFILASEIKKHLKIPVLIMTYVNILFKLGAEKFISLCREFSVDGIIVPDLPFDESFDNVFQKLDLAGIYPIFVVSPDMDLIRLRKITDIARGFIYATLKVGITGERTEIDRKGIKFLKKLKSDTHLPIAAGFGISSPKHIEELKKYADISVIGSHVINLFNKSGMTSVSHFLNECKNVIAS